MQIASDKMVLNRVTELRLYHSQQKIQIMNLLDIERSHIKRFVDLIEERFRQFDMRVQNVPSDLKPNDYERADVHISADAEDELVSKVCYLEVMWHNCLFSSSLILAFKSKPTAIFFQETALNN